MTSNNEVLTTKIRSILRPLPLEEMRDSKKKFQKFYSLTPLGEIEFANRKKLLKHKIEESLKVFQIVYKDLYL